MAIAEIITSHDWHLKNTPVSPSTPPFVFGEPLPIEFDITTEFYSDVMDRQEKHEFIFEGLLKGYLTNSRPSVALSATYDDTGAFGIITRSGGGNIQLTSFVERIWYNNVREPDNVISNFDGNFTVNAVYAFNGKITVTQCNLPVVFEDIEQPLPDEPTEHYYTAQEWGLIAATTAPVFKKVYNWEESIPEGSDFYFKCMYGTSTWTSDQQPAVTQIGWQGYRGTIISGSVNLRKIGGVYNGKLVYQVVSDAVFYNLEKTTDGTSWSAAASLPDTLYRPHENELGTFVYALTEEYYNPLDPYEPDEPENPTGDPDDGEDWGNVYTRSFFTQQYLCGEGAINEISNALYDTTPGGIWEDIKKGLDMYPNYIDAVVNLTYYPLDLSTVFTNVSSGPDIWFGGYKFTMTSHSASKIVYPDGFFYCGGVTIRPKFKGRKDAWRDVYATRLFIDLPYCGRYELDPAKYYNKFVKIIYYIDTRTGGCVACLVTDGGTSGRDGVCLDSYNGQIGTQIPITLTDFSAYANAQIQTLLGMGGQSVSSVGSGANLLRGAVASSSIGAVGGVALGAAALGALQGAKTAYSLNQNNINRFNQTRGGSSAMLNQYLNQKPRFIFEYKELDIPSNFYEMNGGPSNYSGTVGGFSGYFEAEQVKLNMPGATQSEKEKARALLMGGVYI